jgi:integrase
MIKGFFPRGKKLYFRYYDSIKGKPDSKPTSLGLNATNAEMKRWKEEFLYKKRRNQTLHTLIPVSSGIKLQEAFDRIMLTREITQSTKDIYQHVVKKFIEVNGDKPLFKYTSATFRQFIETMRSGDDPYSKNTISIYTRTLSVIWNGFIKAKFVHGDNPVTIIQVEHKPPQRIPAQDITYILDVLMEVNLNAYNVTKFLYLSGFRVSDILTLTWEDIDLEKSVMYVLNYKEKRRDLLPILDPLRVHILTFWPDHASGPVFPMYNSRHSFKFFTRVQVMMWRKQKYTVHQLRKTFISILANSGVSRVTTQQLARHKDYRTTEGHYIQADILKMKNEADDKAEF